MTLDEYKAKITEIVQNPDKSAELGVNLLESIKGDLTRLGELNTSIDKLNGKVKDLQDTNMKLFLAQTNQRPKTDDAEDKPVTLDDMIKAITEDKA